MNPPLRRRPGLAAAVLLAVVLAGYFVWSYFSLEAGAPASRQRPPVYVAAARARSETWHTRLPAVGSLQAIQSVEVTAETGGIVESIHFESGKSVRRGSLLVQLNTEADRARLNNLLAQLKQARADVARNRRLLAGGAIAEAQMEQSQTALKTFEAQVEEQRAVIAKKSIRAPFTGEIGIRRVNLGQFLSPGLGIAALQTIEPIHVNFALPERHYSSVAAGLPIEARVAAYPDLAFEGKISAVNPHIDPETRNFLVQGVLPNERRRLRPGMFADVTVIVAGERPVTTIPATAVSYNPYGDAVFKLDKPEQPTAPERSERRPPADKNGLWKKITSFFRGTPDEKGQAAEAANKPPIYVAVRTFVQVGERRGTEIAIEKGVSPGDLVVTAGQLKLDDGALVIVAENEKIPTPSAVSERP